MKNQFILIVFLLHLADISLGQSHPYEVKFSNQIECDLAKEKISHSKAGLLYSLIGDYQNSVECSEIPVSWGVDTIALEDYSTVNAMTKIIEKAKSHQIVIISENHLKPQHRIFADKIITELYGLGYEHLGLETFTNISNSNLLLDTSLYVRGYPLNTPFTGTFTLEPNMGNLVRNAIKSNFKLFAYERSQKIEGKDRDEIQADNIIRYLNNNPNSKIIIVCGFYHAIESGIIKRGKSYWMAKYIKDKVGIDPLTIYQDNFTEKYIEKEHPILKTLNISEPSVFVDGTDTVIRLSNQVDLEIIHPRTSYINGRPNWLYEDESFKSVIIETAKFDMEFPVIIEAFLLGEVNSVPIDRIELKNEDENKALVLKSGEYRIVLKDGEKTNEYKTKVN